MSGENHEGKQRCAEYITYCPASLASPDQSRRTMSRPFNSRRSMIRPIGEVNTEDGKNKKTCSPSFSSIAMAAYLCGNHGNYTKQLPVLKWNFSLFLFQQQHTLKDSINTYF